MEEKPNSSFIPKKPLARSRSAATGDPSKSVFFKLAVAVFFLCILGVAGVFGYSVLLDRQIESMRGELEEAAAALESSEIDEVKLLDRRLELAERVVGDHRVIARVFDNLSEETLKTVRFTSFELAGETQEASARESVEAFLDEDAETSAPSPATESPETVVTLGLGGEAQTFATVALQAEQFRASEFFQNVQFSNLELSEESGLVTFSVSAQVNPDRINYLKVLNELEETSEQGEEVPGASDETSEGVDVTDEEGEQENVNSDSDSDETSDNQDENNV